MEKIRAFFGKVGEWFRNIGTWFSNLFGKIISALGRYLGRGLLILAVLLIVLGFYFTINLVIKICATSMHWGVKTALSVAVIAFFICAIIIAVPLLKLAIEALNNL